MAKKPEPKLIRDGSEEGYATVAFDPEKRLTYYLNAVGERSYFGVPEGFAWNADGTKLEPSAPAE